MSVVVGVFLALTLVGAGPVQAATSLQVTPLGWEVVGLVSSKLQNSPDSFAVGARVCNNGTTEATNIDVAWQWTGDNPYISLVNKDSFHVAGLAPGACQDSYFNVAVAKVAAVLDKKNPANRVRGYVIQVTADGLTSPLTTPTPRQIYVAEFTDQGRNEILGWSMQTSPGCLPGTPVYDKASGLWVIKDAQMAVGAECTVTIVAKTTPNGYNQLSTS